MAGPTRETVISYGTFDSNDQYWHLHGADDLQLDERTFTCTYDLVCVAPTAALVDSAVSAAEAQLNQRHQDFKIVIDGETLFHFGDGADGVLAGVEGAEFIQASWQTLGTHRSKKSRAYRVTVEVTRAALQTGKIGVYEQRIRLNKDPLNKRRLSFWAQFTPGPDNSESGTALERFDDATYGFDALVTAIQTTLTGTWERTGSLSKAYEEDGRTLTASATYSELIYAQSGTALNDPLLVGSTYDIRLERGAGIGIPEYTDVQPFTAVTVLFTSGAAYDSTDSNSQDLSSVIYDRILPYIKSTVVSTLYVGAQGDPILLGHGLRADPVNNRVAGQVFFLLEESSVLEVSKRISDVARVGDTYVPVLDGTQWTRDKHTGPGMWSRTVGLGCRVVGLTADTVLKSIEESEIRLHKAAGFVFKGWEVNSSPSVEIFKGDEVTGGGRITTVVQSRTLLFERANVRQANAPTQTITTSFGADSASNGELAGFQERNA